MTFHKGRYLKDGAGEQRWKCREARKGDDVGSRVWIERVWSYGRSRWPGHVAAATIWSMRWVAIASDGLSHMSEMAVLKRRRMSQRKLRWPQSSQVCCPASPVLVYCTEKMQSTTSWMRSTYQTRGVWLINWGQAVNSLCIWAPPLGKWKLWGHFNGQFQYPHTKEVESQDWFTNPRCGGGWGGERARGRAVLCPRSQQVVEGG